MFCPMWFVRIESASYNNYYKDDVLRTVYPFTSVDIGVAAGNRTVVIAVGGGHYGSGDEIASVEINGIQATLAVREISTWAQTEIWYAKVSTGTSVDVTVTFGGSTNRCGIGSFSIYGGTGVPYETGGDGNDPCSFSLNVSKANSVIIAVAEAQGSDNNHVDWTGVTEDYDEYEDSDCTHSGAHKFPQDVDASYSIIADFDSASNYQAACAAVWS